MHPNCLSDNASNERAVVNVQVVLTTDWIKMQVQDVGLIFLSAMASSVAAICGEMGMEVKETLGTCLVTLAFATLSVGIITILIGEHLIYFLLSSRGLCGHCRHPWLGMLVQNLVSIWFDCILSFHLCL